MKSICTCVIVIASLSACVPDHADPRTSGKSEGGTSEVKDSQRTQGPAKTASGGSNDGAANRLDPNTYDHFGDGITEGAQAVTLAVVAKDLDKHSGKKIRLTGKVSAVCKKKGCWMFLTEGPTKVRVKFRDYGFFMPLDCEGREAILDGDLSVKEVTVAEIKHLLEDEGKHEEAKKVDQPRHELTVMADGVALKKR